MIFLLFWWLSSFSFQPHLPRWFLAYFFPVVRLCRKIDKEKKIEPDANHTEIPITCARAFTGCSTCDSRVLDKKWDENCYYYRFATGRFARVQYVHQFYREKFIQFEITIFAYTADIYTLLFRVRETDWHARFYNNKYICFRF